MGLFLLHFNAGGVTEDTTAPVVSNANLNAESPNRLVVTWDTDEPAVFRVKMGMTTTGWTTVYNTSHSKDWSTLNPGETYTVYVDVKDAAENSTGLTLLGSITMPLS